MYNIYISRLLYIQWISDNNFETKYVGLLRYYNEQAYQFLCLYTMMKRIKIILFLEHEILR
jgi:hypothetical protein